MAATALKQQHLREWSMQLQQEQLIWEQKEKHSRSSSSSKQQQEERKQIVQQKIHEMQLWNDNYTIAVLL